MMINEVTALSISPSPLHNYQVRHALDYRSETEGKISY